MDKKWYEKTKKLSLEDQWKTLYDIKIKNNHEGLWGGGDGVRNAQELINILPLIFKQFHIKTFLDIGCSNFFWLHKVDWSDVDYLGMDIVEKIIERNKIDYPNFKFVQGNIVSEKPPTRDLIFARSVFIHLTNKEIFSAMENIKNSGSKYLMTSTSPSVKENVDTKCLMLQHRNLTKEPFNFPKPVLLIKERPEILKGRVSYMGLWNIKDL